MVKRTVAATCVLCLLACALGLAGEVDYEKAVAGALKAGKLADVNRLCTEWAKAKPGDERPRLILGRALLKAGMADRALEQFERGVEANPLSPLPRCGIGEVFLQARKPDLAIKEFDAALRLDKACLDALLGKTRARLLGSDPAGALADARQALATHPASARALAAASECLLGLDKLDDALGQARKGIQADPASPDAQFAFARACAALGKDAEAQQHWKRFLQLEPSGERAALVRNGWVLARTVRLPAGCNYTPAWSPDGKRILFGYRQLGLVRLGDRHVTALKAPGEGELFNPDWSPDGKQVLCRRDEPGGRPHIYLCDLHADGSLSLARPQPFCEGVVGRFSPDGRQVLLSAAAFVAEGKRQSVGVALLDLAEGRLHGIPWNRPARTARSHADWSPDGATIVFHAYGRDLKDRALFLMKTGEPATAKQLTDNRAMNITPAFSPDGRTIAFTVVREGAPRTICLTRADGSSKPAPLGHGTDAQWSPDGRRLAYHTYQTKKGIVVAHLSGLDHSPVRFAAKQRGKQLVVTLTTTREKPLAATARYEVFDPSSIRIAQGAVGKKSMELKPGDIIECKLELPAARGDCTVKLTAVASDRSRAVGLVDVTLP